MRIAIICDQFPLPPRNGVTIPIALLIRAFDHHGIEYDIIFLSDDKDVMSYSVDRGVKIISRTKILGAKAYLSELLCIRPVFNSHAYEQCNFDMSDYTHLIFSPISTTSFLEQIELKYSQKKIALINDIYASVLKTDVYYNKTFRTLVMQALARIRYFSVALLEKRILSNFDSVIVQTPKDAEWARCIGLQTKICVLSNGVSDKYLNLVYKRRYKNIKTAVIVSDLSSWLYQKNVLNVAKHWYLVRRAVPLAKLVIVGSVSKLARNIQEMILQNEGVELAGYVPDLSDVYENADFSIAPIHKKYGFINKVAESLAAGVPVLGDPSAYNGLEEFIDQKASLIYTSNVEMVDLIVSMFQNPDMLMSMSCKSKRLAFIEFDNERKYNSILEIIKG